MAFVKTNRAESYEPVKATQVTASEKKLAGLAKDEDEKSKPNSEVPPRRLRHNSKAKSVHQSEVNLG